MSNCICWEKTNDALRDKGFRLSDSLTALSGLNLRLVHILPLQRLDGKKLKRSDAQSITMSHCPFCGAKWEKEAA